MIATSKQSKASLLSTRSYLQCALLKFQSTPELHGLIGELTEIQKAVDLLIVKVYDIQLKHAKPENKKYRWKKHIKDIQRKYL